VGEHHFLPEDWLPGAKSVISFFLPFERATVEANKKDPVEPAIEWVYTRVDGQQFLLALGAAVKDALIAEGYKAVAPYTDDRFIMRVGMPPEPGTEHVPAYSTNWSERHVGVVTGLGTFGQSTNFISKAGCAGRLISVVTDWVPEAYDQPDYDNWLGYCNDCGACIRKCHGNAYFSDRHGKDHALCSAHIRKVCEKHAPRYGCGTCQSGIPCEYKPMRAK
jgi:epoxyqueuosine reductase QueG